MTQEEAAATRDSGRCIGAEEGSVPASQGRKQPGELKGLEEGSVARLWWLGGTGHEMRSQDINGLGIRILWTLVTLSLLTLLGTQSELSTPTYSLSNGTICGRAQGG